MPVQRISIEDISLEQLYDFMERGSLSNAPEHIVYFLETIEKVRSMIYRMDIYGTKEAIIKHLIISEKISKYRAEKLYNETIEYFFVDSHVSKDAWRNFYADKMDKVLNFAMETMKDVSDAAKVIKMMVDITNLRQVNEPDKEKIPDSFFEKPINLLSLDADIFEFGSADKKRLNDIIETFPDLTEKEKNRIKQESRILPLKIFPDEHENIRKT